MRSNTTVTGSVRTANLSVTDTSSNVNVATLTSFTLISLRDAKRETCMVEEVMQRSGWRRSG